MTPRHSWLAILVVGAMGASCSTSGRAAIVDPSRQPPPDPGRYSVARERPELDPDVSDPFRAAAARADRSRLTAGDAAPVDPPGADDDVPAGDRRTSARAGEPSAALDDPSAAKGPPGTSRPRSPRDGDGRPKPSPGPGPGPASASGESLFETDLFIEDLTAKPVKLKSWAGRLTVLNVWATWCGPCRTETPELVKLAKELAPRGVALVGVALDADAVEVRAFMRSYGIEYPMAIGRKKFVSVMDDLGVSVKGVPLTLLLDAEGRVLERYLGMIHRSVLEADVERHLE